MRVADRQQVADGVEGDDGEHRPGELEMQRACDSGAARGQAIAPRPPGVERRTGVGEPDARQHGGQPVLLEEDLLQLLG